MYLICLGQGKDVHHIEACAHGIFESEHLRGILEKFFAKLRAQGRVQDLTYCANTSS